MQILTDQSYKIRELTGKKVVLKRLPRLRFMYDASIAYGNYMNQLVTKVVPEDGMLEEE